MPTSITSLTVQSADTNGLGINDHNLLVGLYSSKTGGPSQGFKAAYETTNHFTVLRTGEMDVESAFIPESTAAWARPAHRQFRWLGSTPSLPPDKVRIS